MQFGCPALILVLSGKRKCGKDFLADILQKRFLDSCAIIRLSAPLKEQYAKENGLNYEELLEATQYKEKFRYDMIRWGEEKRQKDPGYFCRHAILQNPGQQRPVWIVSDARRLTDLEFFWSRFPNVTKTVRITASLDTRTQRGWKFVTGVDDRESECGLDDVTTWDFVVANDKGEEELRDSAKLVINLIESALANTNSSSVS